MRMRRVIKINLKCDSRIPLGYVGENEATEVQFDLSPYIMKFGDGSYTLMHKRNGEAEPYPVSTQRDGNTLKWIVRSADVAKPGIGTAAIILRMQDQIVKDWYMETFVLNSIGISETPPEPWESWVAQVLAAADRAIASIGDLNDLITVNKSSLVDAINETYNHSGGGGASSWERLTGKPFKTLGETLTVDADGVLNIVIPPEYGRVTYNGFEITVS